MANIIGEKLINFEVYTGTDRLLGLADVELPTLETLTESYKGAGIAGEVDAPTVGHYGPLAMTLKWRVTEKGALELIEPKVHALELRGSIQRFNAATGLYETQAVKVVTRAVPKSAPLGTLAPAAAQEPSIEFSVKYLKVFLAGKALVEIDPVNFVCVVNGTDVLAAVRTDLGR